MSIIDTLFCRKKETYIKFLGGPLDGEEKSGIPTGVVELAVIVDTEKHLYRKERVWIDDWKCASYCSRPEQKKDCHYSFESFLHESVDVQWLKDRAERYLI